MMMMSGMGSTYLGRNMYLFCTHSITINVPVSSLSRRLDLTYFFHTILLSCHLDWNLLKTARNITYILILHGEETSNRFQYTRTRLPAPLNKTFAIVLGRLRRLNLVPLEPCQLRRSDHPIPPPVHTITFAFTCRDPEPPTLPR